MTIRTTRRGTLGAAAGIAATAAAARATMAQEKRILRIRSYMDLANIDPAFLRTRETDGVIADAIYSRLIAYKSGTNWEWELDAAESIEQVDTTHIAFTLRRGIQWTNGFGEMTAEDVKYSYERLASESLGSPYASDWAALDHVEVTGTHGGVIVLSRPFAPLFTTTLPWSAGPIVCKAAVEQVGGQYETKVPASSGMFTLKEWLPNQRIVLGRNETYYGELSPFDEVHIIPIGDDKTAELAFEAGELDYTNVAVSSLPELRANPPSGGALQVRPSETYYWIGMNVDHAKFQDIRVRQAVQYALDVDEIIEAAFFGETPRATGIVAPGLIGHRDANMIKGRDVAKAKALLAEAGVPDGFETTITVLNQTDRVTATQVMQSHLAEVGIKAEILAYESGDYWSQGQESDGDDWKKLQIMFLRYASAPDPSWATVWFTCAQVGIWNWERWCNAEFDALHEQAASEMDGAKRHPHYVRMQDLMEQSGAYTFVTHEATAVLYRDTIVPGNRPNNDTTLRGFGLA